MTRTTWLAVGIFIAMTAAVSGCGSHYALAEPVADIARTGLVRDRKQLSRLEKAATDGEIANMLDLDVKAKVPTTLAIAKLDSHCWGYQPTLKRLDAKELEAWERIASKHHQIRGIQPVSNLAFDNSLRAADSALTLRTLRVAAAKLHCELLLVYMQGDSAVDNFNDAAALYWTFAGLWLVPGDTLEHKTVLQAIVVDCRTGMILGTATGDSHKKTICPAMFSGIHRDKLARQAPVEALADLQKGCDRLLLGVISRAIAGSHSARVTHRVR